MLSTASSIVSMMSNITAYGSIVKMNAKMTSVSVRLRGHVKRGQSLKTNSQYL